MQSAKWKMAKAILESRTKEYARRIIRLCAALPRGPAARVLGDQLLRSGTSIGANYREAMRSRSKDEFVAKQGTLSKKPVSPNTGWNSSRMNLSSRRRGFSHCLMKPAK